MLAGGGLFGALVVVAAHLHTGTLIDYQLERNHYLEREIAALDRQIAEIRKIDETRSALIERMRVIEGLQSSRSVTVHLFDELVKTLPEGVYLTSLVQRGASLDIDGKAESEGRVSSYLRSLDASEWLSDPVLKVIQTNIEGGYRISNFSLSVAQAVPQARAGDGGEER